MNIPNRATAATVYHIAFTLNSLADLATSYEQKKARGILPHWPVNHGMSTSMYYTDPDGNEFEMQVNNFDTSEEALGFMATPEYAENPIGVDIDIDAWLKRVRSWRGRSHPEETACDRSETVKIRKLDLL
ncbi:hypothetical protein QBC45DRAFT_443424 [Copromyces sp. CBS 386.78]|nr:hypothetical protein QBC45DRAFT_443424 [Copromyces sp. CBS 386.78]